MIYLLKSKLKSSKDSDFLSENTLKLADISDEELRAFGLLESIEALKTGKSTMINSFHEIGWIDPFPKLSAD